MKIQFFLFYEKLQNNFYIQEENELAFLLIMSVKALGGGLKALTDMSAKNIVFLRLPEHISQSHNKYICTYMYSLRTVMVLRPLLSVQSALLT